MHSVYVDFNCSGHHPRHIEHVLSLSNGSLLTSRKSIEFIRPGLLTTTRINVIALDVGPEDFREHVNLIDAWCQTLSSEFGQIRVVHLAIDDIYPYLCFRILVGNFRYPIIGVWMAFNTFHTRDIDYKCWLKFWTLVASWIIVFNLCVQRGSRLLFLNEIASGWLQDKFGFSGEWADWIPDPPDIIQFDSQPLCIPTTLYDVSFLGVHSERKGTVWALNALRNWSGGMLRVLVAGKIEGLAQLNETLSSLPECVSVDVREGYLDEAELLSYIRSSKIVCAPYRFFGGSSGIVSNAIAAGVAVLVPNFGVLGVRISQLDQRMAFRHGDPEDFLRSLAALLPLNIEPNFFHNYITKHSRTIYLKKLAHHYA